MASKRQYGSAVVYCTSATDAACALEMTKLQVLANNDAVCWLQSSFINAQLKPLSPFKNIQLEMCHMHDNAPRIPLF